MSTRIMDKALSWPRSACEPLSKHNMKMLLVQSTRKGFNLSVKFKNYNKKNVLGVIQECFVPICQLSLQFRVSAT
jgi:hypothetical protein